MCYMSKNHSRWMHHPKFNHWKSGHRNRPTFMSGWNYPPVNVQELDDKYELFVYASGYQKGDFTINVVTDALVISAQAKSEEGTKFDWRRKEFDTGAFERKFALPEGVDVENIQAKYRDGVLTIELPKLEGFETKRMSVEIG